MHQMLHNNVVRPFLFLLSAIILFGCSDCKYTIKADYIKSNCAFNYGFMFQELSVDSFNKQHLPEKYEVIREISLSPIKEGVQKSKKIYFYKENKKYEWHDIRNATLHRILPVKMEPEKWYIIRGLVFRGHPDRAAFLHINKKGEFLVYGYSESKIG